MGEGHAVSRKFDDGVFAVLQRGLRTVLGLDGDVIFKFERIDELIRSAGHDYDVRFFCGTIVVIVCILDSINEAGRVRNFDIHYLRPARQAHGAVTLNLPEMYYTIID